MRTFGTAITRSWWQNCRIIALCIVVCTVVLGAILFTLQQQWGSIGLLGPWFAFTILPLFIVVAIGTQARMQERADMVGGPQPIDRDAES